jgi:hypothetical protein
LAPIRGRRSAGYRLAWVVLALALLVAGLLAVPQTRAALLELFARMGAIDVFIDETAPTATPEGTREVTPVPTGEDGAMDTPDTPRPDGVTHSLALYELGEPVTLAEARRLADYPLTVPETLGEPDEVYVHRADLPAVTLVWRDEAGNPVSLTEIGADAFAMKFIHEPGVKTLRVGDRPAVWLAGPHRLRLLDSWQESDLRIDSNVLIWVVGDVTLRLEGDLSEAEMVALAESLVE